MGRLTFGQFLRRRRGARTLEDLGETLGYVGGYVGIIETGRAPSLAFVHKVCAWDPENARKWMRLGARAHGWEV